jgi:hypothetical protein
MRHFSNMRLPALLSNLTAGSFGILCIASALPFVGVPFPTRAWSDYYADKNRWLSQLSGQRLSPAQAGYAGAALRLVSGACCIYPPTREAMLLIYAAIVCRGTMLASRDGRPMAPQWGMLSATVVCLVLGRL